MDNTLFALILAFLIEHLWEIFEVIFAILFLFFLCSIAYGIGLVRQELENIVTILRRLQK